ncbi:hypothetical protein Vafri_1308 [Volvox africanus]|nr:hypothetical protein Vafri_1308 [Volvox africanus]
MGSQRPLGCAGGLRRTVTTLQVPGASLRGSSSLKLCSLRRRLFRPSAAIGFSEVLAGSWSDAESIIGGPTAVRDTEHLRSTSVTAADNHSNNEGQQSPLAGPHHEHLRLRQQQQQRDVPRQLGQRLVPTTPVASATKFPARTGVGASGVALGILLTVAFQLVSRWLQRQRWAKQLIELLDLRRSSGSRASTSGTHDGGAAARRPYGRSDAGASKSHAGRTSPGSAGDFGIGSSDGADSGHSAVAAAAAGRSAFSGGAGAGGSPGSTLLGMMDGAGLGAGQGATSLASFAASGAAGPAVTDGSSGSLQLPLPPGPGSDPGESVEWVNMCWRKVWRVYQRGLERWIIDLLQPVFDGLVKDGSVPRWLCRLRVVELTLDHEAPYFSNMRRRNSRKDSDLNGVVDLRYTGGARMLLMLELGEGRWRFKVPVLVSDLDLECQMWLKLRLAPMCPWIGTISLAFVGPPNVKVQLSPYNRVRLMRVPVVQNYLRKLLTVDLPALMVLPQRLEINIPPSVTTIAEAAVGRDTIMRAVASAVLQADAVEAALLAALPLGPQTPAGGVTLPEAFKGELSVTLREARDLPVWGFPGQSNPYVRLVLGEQAVQSRREGDTSHPGRHRAPVWNQEFQFLVEDPEIQVLEMLVKDSHLTGRTDVGRASIKLADLLVAQRGAEGGKLTMWVPLQPPVVSYGISGGEPVPTGDVLLELSYKAFDDEEHDSGYRESENFSKQAAAQVPITDIRSAAAASSRAAVAASAAMSAIAMTRAAAARAAARAARAAQEAAAAAAGAAKGAVDQGASMIAQQQQQQQQQQQPPTTAPPKQLPAKATSAAASVPPPRAAHASATPSPTTTTTFAKEREHTATALEGSSVIVPLPAAIVAGSLQGAEGVGRGDDGGKRVGEVNGHVGLAPPLVAASVGGAAAESSGRWTRSVAVAVRDVDGGVSDGSQLMALPDGRQAITLTTSALAAVQPSRAAMAVLERPPAAAVEDLYPIDVGGGGNGHSFSQHTYEGAGDGGVAAGSRWRQRHSSLDSDGGGGGRNGSRHGGDDASRSEPLHVEILELPHHPDGAAPGQSPSAAAAAAAALRQLQPLQHITEGLPIDVPAEVVVPTPPSSQSRSGTQKVQDQAAADISGGGGGGGGGDTGTILSALMHLTASAQSLTATAFEKALETLSQKPAPPPPAQEHREEGQGEAAVSDRTAADGGGDDNWLAAIVSRLPRYGGGGGGQPQHHVGSEEEDGLGSIATDATDRTTDADADAGDDHPWWQFWVPKGGAAKLHDAAAAASIDGDASAAGEAAASTSKSGEPPTDGAAGRGKPWWQFWPDDKGEEDEDKASKQADGGSKPVEAIYIPPDLPLEEIAAEVQRLKEDSWRERSDHVSNLWMKAVERNDRKWLMLAAFLLSVAVGLLTVVAWRLEQLEHMQAATPQVVLMTMQAALQALEQQANNAGGSLF